MSENIIEKVTIRLPASFNKVLRIINENALGIVFVIDSDDRLVGSISDGDIRRSILRGKNLNADILTNSDVINKKTIIYAI